MHTIKIAASVLLLGSALVLARPSHACTQPTEGADEPTVTPGEEPGTDPSEEPGVNPGEEPGTSPGEEPGTGPADTSQGGGEDTVYDTPPELQTIASPLVAISWKPGREVDADPNAGYFRHTGHTIATRLVVRDAVTKAVVLETVVPQYDYETVKRGEPARANTSYLAQLPPGRYEAKVQSVFKKHDEIRYGMEGRWISADTAAPAPAIGESVRGISFAVREAPMAGEVGGGCSAVGGGWGSMLPALALLLARRRR